VAALCAQGVVIASRLPGLSKLIQMRALCGVGPRAVMPQTFCISDVLHCRGIIGFSLVAKGRKSVIWYDIDNKETFPVKGVVAIVISWFISPILSGIACAIFFLIVRAAILRSDHSFDRAWMFLPILVLFCVFINAFYVLDKGISLQWKQSTAKSAWISAIIAVAAGIITAVVAMSLRKRALKSEDDKEAKRIDNAEKGVTEVVKEKGASTIGCCAPTLSMSSALLVSSVCCIDRREYFSRRVDIHSHVLHFTGEFRSSGCC
jgi:hypothetical protein